MRTSNTSKKSHKSSPKRSVQKNHPLKLITPLNLQVIQIQKYAKRALDGFMQGSIKKIIRLNLWVAKLILQANYGVGFASGVKSTLPTGQAFLLLVNKLNPSTY